MNKSFEDGSGRFYVEKCEDNEENDLKHREDVMHLR